MRTRRLLVAAVAAALIAAGFGAVTPTEASNAGAIAGSCDLVQIRVDSVNGKHRLTTPNGGICAVSKYNGVNIASSAGQIAATIEFTSPDVDLVCSGSAVRGFNGPVTVAVHGNGTDTFPDVSMIVDSASGTQTLNPTAAALIDGIRFAGAGTFARSGSGSCDGATTWSLGHVTFEDPTLGGSSFPGA